MGQYLVNGELVEMRETNPTAEQLRTRAGGSERDWVMAAMPDGKIVKLDDAQALPKEAQDFSIVPAFEYGTTPPGASLQRLLQ